MAYNKDKLEITKIQEDAEFGDGHAMEIESSQPSNSKNLGSPMLKSIFELKSKQGKLQNSM